MRDCIEGLEEFGKTIVDNTILNIAKNINYSLQLTGWWRMGKTNDTTCQGMGATSAC